MEVEQITKRIIHLKFDTQEQVAAAFMRFQEHYESPEWKGKIFTVGQYLDWYSRKYGAATYTRDWSGFNIPSHIFQPFINGLFDPLTKAEERIVDMFRFRTDRFYVIGTSGEAEEDTLDHEVCHGLYYTCPTYKKAVDEYMTSFDYKPVLSHLREKGYCEEVLQDEAHAYLSASVEYLAEEEVEYHNTLHVTLRTIYETYLEQEKAKCI